MENKRPTLSLIAKRFRDLTGANEVKAAILLMCADHGVAKQEVSAFSQNVTLQMMKGYCEGTAAASVLADFARADVFVVDVGTASPYFDTNCVRSLRVASGTVDFTKAAAMDENQVSRAMKAGMLVAGETINKGYNLLLTGEMGIGNTTSSAALISAMLGLSPDITVGRGSGISDERLKIKRQVVLRGLQVNKPKQGDGFDCLKKLGGFEHAALAGAMMMGMNYGVPTVLDGINATAAALCAWGMDKEITKYLFASHLSAENAHAVALEKMGLVPVLKAGMRVGEGTGASLFAALLRLALKNY